MVDVGFAGSGSSPGCLVHLLLEGEEPRDTGRMARQNQPTRKRRRPRMKYMMFVATDPEPDQGTESMEELEAWFAEVTGRGKHVTGDRLRPVEDATTVRVRAGELLVT